MDTSFIAITLSAFGTIAIGYAALRVHYRILHEHKVDKRVFRTMKLEQTIGWTGIVLIVIGYLLTIFS